VASVTTGRKDVMDSPEFILQLVMLDEDLRTAFVTRDPAKADEARRLLAASFGEDRISVRRYGESSIDEYRRAITLWQNDPRIVSSGDGSDSQKN
jgi:hypothetical protein